MRLRTTALTLVLGLAAAPGLTQDRIGRPSASSAALGCAQAGAPASPEAFAALDDNGDGFVSPQEYVEQCGKLGAAVGNDEVAAAQFQALDADGDRRISSDEYASPAQFGAIDSPGDSPAAVQNRSGDRASGAQADGAVKAGERELQADVLIGMDVVNAKGEQIGEVRDLVLDGSGPAHAVVSVGGFLGFGAKNVAIPFDQLRLDAEHIVLMSEAGADELKELPAYGEGQLGRGD